jgi:hypothetical protein
MLKKMSSGRMEIQFEIPKSKPNKLGVIILVEVKLLIIHEHAASSREMRSLLPLPKKNPNWKGTNSALVASIGFLIIWICAALFRAQILEHRDPESFER